MDSKEDIEDSKPDVPNAGLHGDVFEMMNFLTGVSDTVKKEDDSTENLDVSNFVKKKKKKAPEDVIPQEALEKTKVFEKVEKPVAKPKPSGSAFEYAEALSVGSTVPEYVKMKHNLAKTVSYFYFMFYNSCTYFSIHSNSILFNSKLW